MQQTINNTLIKNVELFSRPYEIWDDRLRGFVLRVQPSGVMTYYVQYARGKRYKIGRADVLPVKQARDMAIQILAEVGQGIDPNEKRKKINIYTVKQFIDETYEPWIKVNLKWSEATLKVLRRGFSGFQNKSLIEINSWDIEKWRSEKLKLGLKRSTINRQISDLRAMFSRAVAWGFLKENPLMTIKPLKLDTTPNVRYLSEDEELRLRNFLDTREEKIRKERETANQWRLTRKYSLMLNLRTVAYADHLKPLVLLSLNTGLRRGELFSLTWEHINFNRALLTIIGSTAKSGKTRHIPLNKEALMILRGWHAQSLDASPCAYVFPGKEGKRLDNVKRSWKKTLEDANITSFRWHDLRHTFASNLVMSGVDLNTVRELLGHADYNMTLRYAHLASEHKASAVEKLIRESNR